jgi:uncharacterized membrane protein YidH (DUF202 family)
MTQKEPQKPTLWQVLISVLGALFGVQSRQVHQRDFLHGRSWWVYMLVGVIVVSVFVLLLILLANLSLKWGHA